MNDKLLLFLTNMILALVNNGPQLLKEIKELLSNSSVVNKDELIAQIEESQKKWPEWV